MTDSSPRFFYVVVYDISDNKRRLKISKLMESLGFRVQGSVFEGYLTNQERNRLVERVNRIIDPDQDSVRIYLLCNACRSRMVIIGQGKVNHPPGVVIL